MIVVFVVYSALFIAFAVLPLWIGADCWADIRSGEAWENRANTGDLPPAGLV